MKSLCSLLLLLLIALPAAATISIRPAYVDVEIANGRASGKFHISNLGDEEQRFRMTTTHFTFDLDGALDTIEPDDHSSAEWIRFNPREFTLPAKSQRVVRFALVPGQKLPPGDYWSAIELESLNLAVSKVPGENGREMTVNTISAILIPVFSRSGAVRGSADITAGELSRAEDGAKIEVTVENTGNRCLLLDGEYSVSDGAGGTIVSGRTGQAYLLRDGRRRFRLSLPPDLPRGEYPVHVSFRSPQMEQELAKDFTISW